MIKLHTLFTLFMSDNAMLRVVELLTDATDKWQIIIDQGLLAIVLNPLNTTSQIVVLNISFLDSLVNA